MVTCQLSPLLVDRAPGSSNRKGNAENWGYHEMKILMVISQFHPIVGGAEKQALLLSQTLNEMGHGIKVVTGWWLTDTPRREIVEQVSVIRNFSVWGMFGLKGFRPVGTFAYMITLLLYLVLHKNEYDIVHIHQALYPAFVGVMAAKLLKKHTVVKVGCSGKWGDMKVMSEGKIPFGKLMLKMIRKCDRIVATNRNMARELKESGFPQERIVFIPNGVAVINQKKNYRQIIPGAPSLVYAGRLSSQKGIDILLQAIQKIKGKKVFLKILGKGPELKNLQKMVLKFGIQEQVKFHGNVCNVWQYLADSDIFVLPSRSEGMPNSLLEAMGAGLPCIATHIPGNTDLIHGNVGIPAPGRGKFKIGKNGITVSVDDSEGLAGAIDTIMRDRSLRERLGQHARRKIQAQFTISSVADRYTHLYQSLGPRSKH